MPTALRPQGAERFAEILFGAAILLGLYLTHLYSFLLFHSLAEVFSITVACAVFMFTWNSRRFLDNNYLLCIGIASLFIGGVDLIHTLAYKGMGVFPGGDANLPTQLWIAARYLQGASLLMAPWLLGRTVKARLIFVAYAVAVGLLLGAIFYWRVFPDCYVEGVGLTPFKKLSEYAISVGLLASIPLLLRRRHRFDEAVLRLLIWSILVTAASELAFTFYIDVYSASNLVGHFFKITAFYLLYKAIIRMGLMQPYSLLFRNLKQSEEALRRSEERLRTVVTNAPLILFTLNRAGVITFAEGRGLEALGLTPDALVGQSVVAGPMDLPYVAQIGEGFDRAMAGEAFSTIGEVGGSAFETWYAPLRDPRGEVAGVIGTAADITERRRAQERLHLQGAALEAAANAIVITDHDGAITWVNPAFTSLTGYTEEEALGRNPRILKSGKHDASFYRNLMETLYAGQVWRGEIINRRKDGSLYIEEQTITPVRDADGAIRHFIAIKQDITPRKRAKMALIERTRQLEAVRAVMAEIARELDLPSLLGLIARRAEELIGAGDSMVWLWDEAAQALIPGAWSGGGEWRKKVRLQLGEGVAGTVAKRRRGLIVNDYRTSPYAVRAFLEHTQATSVLGEPLLCHDKLVGVITVDNEGLARPLAESDRKLLTLLAAQAAIAIENARLHTQR